MTTVFKKLLCSDGQNIDFPDQIAAHHAQEAKENKLRHYFLGGLLHINGFEIDGSLGSMLRDFIDSKRNDISTYIVTINVETNGMEEAIGHTADQMHNLKNVPVTTQGREASKLIIASDALLDKWASMDKTKAHNAMNKHFAQIILTGYSYGTSLIQQMEADMVHRLRSRKLPITPLLQVKAFNIGAVDMPHCDRGFRADFNYVANNTQGKRSGFRQVFAVKAIDKIMDSVIGRRLLPIVERSGALFSYGDERVKYYIDQANDADIKRIGLTRFAEGREVARLNVNYDPEAHDLRLYLNRQRVVNDGKGAFMTFSSSPLSGVLKNAMQDAINGDISFNQQDTAVASSQYQTEVAQFQDIRMQYERSSFKGSIEMVKQLISINDNPPKP